MNAPKKTLGGLPPVRENERSPSHGGETDGVVTAHDDGHRTGRRNVGDRVGDLVERLLDVSRDGEHVPRVAHGHLLAQVYPRLVVVRCV